MVGHRGIWSDGWKAVTRHAQGDDYSDDNWELYHLEEDFSESHNLAEAEPQRLREMIDLWWIEAGRYGVLPLDDRTLGKGGRSPHPGAYHEIPTYRFSPPISHVPGSHAPQVGRGNWKLTADIEVPDPGTEGVIYAQGSVIDGFSLFIQDRKLGFAHNGVGEAVIGESDEFVPQGRTMVGLKSLRSPSAGIPGVVVWTSGVMCCPPSQTGTTPRLNLRESYIP
jgi:arylsulfatase